MINLDRVKWVLFQSKVSTREIAYVMKNISKSTILDYRTGKKVIENNMLIKTAIKIDEVYEEIKKIDEKYETWQWDKKTGEDKRDSFWQWRKSKNNDKSDEKLEKLKEEHEKRRNRNKSKNKKRGNGIVPMQSSRNKKR